jgi:hypothetical protein
MRKRDLAGRSDKKPLRSESSNPGKFRSWMNRSHLKVEGCYCVSARMDDSGGRATKKRDRPKERRRKAGQNENPDREGHAGPAGRVKNFQAPAMLKTTPLDCEQKSNLRVKRRDPWPRANAPAKPAADPEPVVKTRTIKLQACLDLVCRPVAQPLAEAS